MDLRHRGMIYRTMLPAFMSISRPEYTIPSLYTVGQVTELGIETIRIIAWCITRNRCYETRSRVNIAVLGQ